MFVVGGTKFKTLAEARNFASTLETEDSTNKVEVELVEAKEDK